jgi:hypothetical protein
MNLTDPARSAAATIRGARKQLLLPLLLLAASCAALPAQAAGENPASPSATLSVSSSGGSAAELLDRITLPQLAAMLNTTPQRLGVQLAGRSGPVAAEVGVLAEEPLTTAQDVLDFLAAHGVSTTPVEQVLSSLTAGLTATPQQLQTTIDQALSDLRETDQLPALAHELALPPAALESAQLVPTTAQQVANSLGTSVERLSSTLLGAGVIKQALTPLTPLVNTPVAGATPRTTTLLVGAPNGKGGVSLTTVSAAPPGTTPGTSAPPAASNAFKIVKIRVARNGMILETVSLPAPGRLAIKATTPRRIAVRARNGHRRTSIRSSTIGKAQATLAGGLHTLALRLRSAAGHTRSVAVTLATTYTPSGGVPRTLKRSLTVRHSGRRRRR